MQFISTPHPDIKIVVTTPAVDERGSLSRLWCQNEFREAGLESQIVQVNSVATIQAGTVRGLHFQEAPHAETKFIQCLRGKAWVVAVDLRKDSAHYLKHVSVELSGESGKAIYVPQGFAQGYQTLEHDTEVLYFMSAVYVPEAARGYKYDDPAFGISWPKPAINLSDRDAAWAKYQ